MMGRDEQAVFALRELYENFGYSRFKMSRFEEYDLYVSNKDFLISDEVITFTDRSGRLLAMKPDVTLSIIKNAPDSIGEILKAYYNENVYRVSGGKSFKEIMQIGLECIGDLSDYEITEVVLLAAKSLALISNNFIMDISHMGLVSAVLESGKLSKAGADKILTHLQKKNVHQIKLICEEESLSESSKQKLVTLAECFGDRKSVMNTIAPILTEEKELKALTELDNICKILERCGFAKKINIDFSVGNALKYYSGVVFKGYIEGIPTGILSGGQYDKLLNKMGRKSKAIGFAIYTDLLQRLEKKYEESIVDAVIIHDGNDICGVAEAVLALSEKGKVLALTSLPTTTQWKRLYKFENGVVKLIEENC